ncbi:MAG: peptidase S41 [Flavobacteriaceae bacterium]|nr:peptidase S41 [Flavobacteriaceae bacterium]
MKNFKFLSLFLMLFFLNCSKDKDDNLINLEGELEISDFVWKGLNYYYYWQKNVPNLSDTMDDDANSYTTFISQNSDPEIFFDELLFSEDRFSWIVDDYIEHANSLSGIVAHNGMEFGLTYQCSGCTDLVGYVRYIQPNSNASTKEIYRGNFFITVNGFSLNIDNYRELLYSDDLTYTLGLANYDQENGIFDLNGQNITLTKQENFQINPIHKTNIYSLGENNIGYLHYSKFLADYTDELNDVFANFKSSNITDLVLDLRYNSGGSIYASRVLCSLITGQFSNQVLISYQWNDKLMDYWNENNPESLTKPFVNKLDDNSSLNSLNLERIYVLTSSRTASASEMLINGLSPYIDVIQIGDYTVGKNVGSITVHDYIDNDGTKNPNHKYAMQPIVIKVANKDGYADFDNGLPPDINQKESLSNLGILSSPSEPLFLTAINLITGNARNIENVKNPIEYTIENPKINLEQIATLEGEYKILK